MMSQLMLVNPKKRRTKKRRTTAKRKTTTRRRRRNPITANPKKRYSRRKRNPAKGLGSINSIVKKSVMPSITAAGGALALDMVMGFLPLPDNLKSGPMSHVTRGVAAIGMGMIASNIVSRQTAELFTSGALTVAAYNAAKQGITQFAPDMAAKMNLGLYEEFSGLGYYGSGYNPEYSDESLAYYPDESQFDGLNAYEEAEEPYL